MGYKRELPLVDEVFHEAPMCRHTLCTHRLETPNLHKVQKKGSSVVLWGFQVTFQDVQNRPSSCRNGRQYDTIFLTIEEIAYGVHWSSVEKDA